MENSEELEKNKYIHKKSGKTYTKLGSASEQIDGIWYKTKIVYKNSEEDYFNVNNSNCCDATITEHSRLCSKCLEHL